MSEKKHKQEITEGSDKLEEMEVKYKRALADYQNLLKQVERDKVDFAKYAGEKLISEFLPIYDYLKISLVHAGTDNEWLTGVKHVLAEFKKVLERAGVTEIITTATHFDPTLMEAVATQETADETQEDVVAEEVKAGYKLHERVIVPAGVIVFKHKKTDDTKI